MGSSSRRSAFTLIELLLGIVLTAILLTIVAMATNIHYRIVRAGRSHIEEAQLARSLLRRIADDLRGTVQFNPQKIEGYVLPELPEAEDEESETSETNPSATPTTETPAEPMMENAEEEEEGEEEDPEEVTADTANIESNPGPKRIPGIYGNRSAVQIDVGRLPRLDRLMQPFSREAAESGVAAIDRPSDVKSVAYYVVSPEKDMIEAGGRRGLVRREVDRAVAQYASTQGRLELMERELMPIAPEVAGIEFRYYLGEEEMRSWDTRYYEQLPTAVLVTLYIIPKEARSVAEGGTGERVSDGPLEKSSLLSYSLLVGIPAAESALSPEEEEAAESAEGGETGEGGKGSSSSGGKGSAKSGSGTSDEASADGGGTSPGRRRAGNRNSDRSLGRDSMERGSIRDRGGEGGRGGRSESGSGSLRGGRGESGGGSARSGRSESGSGSTRGGGSSSRAKGGGR